jgi:hypothetical protein
VPSLGRWWSTAPREGSEHGRAEVARFFQEQAEPLPTRADVLVAVPAAMTVQLSMVTVGLRPIAEPAPARRRDHRLLRSRLAGMQVARAAAYWQRRPLWVA